MRCLWKRVAAVLLLGAAGAQAETDRLRVPTRYDVEYPVLAYSAPATHNRIWRLQQRLDSGELKLTWEPTFGYLRSLLQALEINPDTQALVFSRTSLQIEHISARTPRAVYFNDDTYVAHVHDTPLVEITAIDAEKGPVFFAFDNRREMQPVRMEREGGRCLSCHDTYSMMGGGVPRVMVMSAPVDDAADTRTYTAAEEVDDRTPIAQRWGGWYVTGHTGAQNHFGNLALREERGGERLRELQATRLNLASVKAYVDATTYLTDHSDVAALMVLEHQTWLQNLITRVNYKVRTVMSRDSAAPATGAPRTWADITAGDQKRMQQMIEPLVRALFFQEATPLAEPVRGGSGFAERFARVGPLDSQGRGLHQLDLATRLQRYPLSYVIYTDHFDALPQYALDYVYARIVEVLQGRDSSGISARITPADRTAITQILIDTKPALAALLR
ncbi:MAG: hypothetical protein ABW278_12420 [Steroidobacteraceae bacterium]